MKKEVCIPFSGGSLNTLAESDVTLKYVDGLNDPEVTRYMVTAKDNLHTRESLQDYIKSNSESEGAIFFGIRLIDKSDISGTIRIYNIEYTFQTAIIGICLFDKTAWGKGIGSKAVKAATKWCFDEMKLRWIEACTFDSNIASRKCFINAGYEWITDIPGKFHFEGKPATINILAAKNPEIV